MASSNLSQGREGIPYSTCADDALAAKSLMRLALGNAHTADVDVQVDAPIMAPYPTAPALGNRLPILPPWSTVPTQITSRSNGEGEVHEGDDISLSLYVGAERFTNGEQVYRDLSNITFDDVKVVVDDPSRQGIFPVLLHKILSCDKYSDSIMWLPHGRAFVIVNMQTFFSQVTPSYFCTYDCGVFLHWLEYYGFQQAEYPWNEIYMVAFYHERFLRYRPWLTFTMKPGRHAIPSHGETHQDALHHLEKLPWLEALPAASPEPKTTDTDASYDFMPAF